MRRTYGLSTRLPGSTLPSIRITDASLDEGAAQHGIDQLAPLVGAGMACDAQTDVGAARNRAQFHDFLSERDGVADIDRPRPFEIAQARRRTGSRHGLAARALFRLPALTRQHDVTQAHRRRVPA